MVFGVTIHFTCFSPLFFLMVTHSQLTSRFCWFTHVFMANIVLNIPRRKKNITFFSFCVIQKIMKAKKCLAWQCLAWQNGNDFLEAPKCYQIFFFVLDIYLTSSSGVLLPIPCKKNIHYLQGTINCELPKLGCFVTENQPK